MRRDQLAGRYFIKVTSSVLMALCNFVIQFLLPRAISVQEYGFYSYNLNVFTSVVLIANFSTSGALVAKYSKKNEDIGYVKFYLSFFVIISIILNVLLVILYSFNKVKETFGGQTLIIVLLGLESTVLIKLIADINSLYDAAAISRFPSMVQIIQRFVLCLFVIGSFYLGFLNLLYFYIGQFITFLIAIIVLVRAFYKDFKSVYGIPVVRNMIDYIKEYYIFCKPLVIAGFISQGIIILMNYVLMKYSGVEEQAMFGVAWQLNTLVAYLFSPFAEIMKREFSVIANDMNALRYRLRQSVKMIIWLGTFPAIFIAVNAKWILPLLYGDSYINAVSVTQMIMLYTIFQAWGQLCGSFMIAIETTKSYAFLSVISQIVSVICVFLFQIPNFLFEKGLGSMGIGLTYMCSNYISTVITMIIVFRKTGDSLIRFHGVYIISIGLCTFFAISVKSLFEPLFNGRDFIINLTGLMISGFCYSIIIITLLILFPQLVGLKRSDIKNLWDRVSKKWERR